MKQFALMFEDNTVQDEGPATELHLKELITKAIGIIKKERRSVAITVLNTDDPHDIEPAVSEYVLTLAAGR